MRGKSSNTRPTIGLFTNILNNVQADEVWAGATVAAQELDVNLLCFPTWEMRPDWYDEPSLRSVLFDLAKAENIDGVITFYWWYDRDSFEKFYNLYRPLPVVNVIRWYEGYPGVAWSNHSVMHTLVNHLVTVHNYRRIAYLNHHSGNTTCLERYQGYADALADHGIEFDDKLVVPIREGQNCTLGSLRIKVLLDEHGLRPGVDFEAVLAFNDGDALSAMAELQERGVQVPDDVAVVGINDILSAHVATPPLTTVRMPRVDMGQRAVEMLVAQLRGEPVPEREALLPQLMVRRSCGCLSGSVQLAGKQSLQSTSDDFTRKDKVITAMINVANEAVTGDETEWAAQLVDSLTTDSFLLKWEELLDQTINAGGNVRRWQDVLSVMHNHLRYSLDGEEMEIRWQQARVIVSEAIRRAEQRQHLQVTQQNQILREISQALITSFDMKELMDVLTENMPRLDIPSCFLVLYENPEQPAGFAKLVLAYRDNQRVKIEQRSRRFLSQQLMPAELLPQERCYSLVVEALYFRQEQIGFVLFEVGPREGAVYEILRGQISSALKGALLLQAHKQAEKELRTHRDHLDELVQERTAQLTTTNEHLRQEIGERQRAEQELFHLRNYLANIIDSMPSVLIGVDNEGLVTQWNGEAQRATRISVAKAMGQPLIQTFPRLAGEMKRVREAIETRTVQTDTKRAWMENGETRYEDITVYPLIENGVEGAVIRVDDVTEQVRLEELMVQNEKLLSVGGLAAGMAHEINNPLAGIMQTASVMNDRLTNLDIPANQRAAQEANTSIEAIRAFMEARGIPRMLEAINSSGKRAAEIIDNMLSFAQKSQTAVSSYQVADLLDKTLELAATDFDLKKQYDFKTVKIVRDYKPNLPLVPCEGAKIQQVLLNILRNGSQAMQEANTKNPTFVLRVWFEEDHKFVRIEIEDNGPGMDEAISKRVFEPFFTTKPVGMGTGLGLSVSYFIITENHGGQMDVFSEPGRGTTFVVRLPVERKRHLL